YHLSLFHRRGQFQKLPRRSLPPQLPRPIRPHPSPRRQDAGGWVYEDLPELAERKRLERVSLRPAQGGRSIRCFSYPKRASQMRSIRVGFITYQESLGTTSLPSFGPGRFCFAYCFSARSNQRPSILFALPS